MVQSVAQSTVVSGTTAPSVQATSVGYDVFYIGHNRLLLKQLMVTSRSDMLIKFITTIKCTKSSYRNINHPSCLPPFSSVSRCQLIP